MSVSATFRGTLGARGESAGHWRQADRACGRRSDIPHDATACERTTALLPCVEPFERILCGKSLAKTLRTRYSILILATRVDLVAGGCAHEWRNFRSFQIAVGPMFRAIGTYPSTIGIVPSYTYLRSFRSRSSLADPYDVCAQDDQRPKILAVH